MQDNLQHNHTELDIEENVEISKYPIWKWIGCYLLSLVLVLVLMFGLTEGIVRSIQSLTNYEGLSAVKVITFVSIAYFIFMITKNLGDHWRANENVEIGTAVTGFPNIFFDANFQKGPLRLQRQYNKLYSEYRRMKLNLEHSRRYVQELGEHIAFYVAKLRVLLRHNENANRLIRSLNYLYKEQDKDFSQKMLRSILAECVTILEKDQSDKSISLFKLNNNKLEIVASVRINAESIAKRVFKKGQGFAGHIWETGEAKIINYIDPKDERFNDFNIPATPIGSILGFPLQVENDILGVLCLQSEEENGFNDADLRTVEFYARLCTMIFLYDKIKIDKQIAQGGE